MALIKRILLFFLSIIFIIFLLIGATTSYAKDEFYNKSSENNLLKYIKDLKINHNEINQTKEEALIEHTYRIG